MASLWSTFPLEWFSALNTALTRDFDYPLPQNKPRIVHGGFVAGFLFRWPFKVLAVTIAQTIHLSPRWEKLRLSSEREAFLTIAHETVHVAQQARSTPWLPRGAAFYGWWLPRYLLLGIYACLRAWTRLRLYQASTHPWERPAYAFEAKLRDVLP